MQRLVTEMILGLQDKIPVEDACRITGEDAMIHIFLCYVLSPFCFTSAGSYI
jgi:hypothetical protein